MKQIRSCIAVAGFALLVFAVLGLIATGGTTYAQSLVKSGNPLSGDEDAIAKGKTLFRAGCSNCHGMRANGRGRGARSGPVANLQKFKRGYTAFVQTVKNGYKKMPPWGGLRHLSDEEINQVGAWLETLAKPGAKWDDPE
ncbi:MAG: cytochrome c [SAR324 cluster bacterium]|nr:cytochrome c [SAR324 cluster bacterium]